jgi:hypothetical protein
MATILIFLISVIFSVYPVVKGDDAENIPVIDTNNRSYSIYRLFIGHQNGLIYPEEDAQLLKVTFDNWGLLARDSNTLLIGGAASPTFISHWFDELAKPPPIGANDGDVVLVYFSGDGIASLILLAKEGKPEESIGWEPKHFIEQFNKIRQKVRVVLVFDSCFSLGFIGEIRQRIVHRPFFGYGNKGETPDAILLFGIPIRRSSHTYRRLIPGLEDDGTNHTKADKNRDGITTAGELYDYANKSPWGFEGNDDGDYYVNGTARVDEDDVEHVTVNSTYMKHEYIDNDGDGYSDEDPAPKYCGYITGAEVGGIVFPVDKFALLAPYIGLASTVTVAAVAAVIYVKRVKRGKEKQ